MHKYKEILVVLLFILIGVVTRVIFHINPIAPNLEVVTALSLSSAYFFRNKKIALFVPIGIMIGSDLIIGNTSIYLFTWTGFLITFFLGFISTSYKTSSRFKLGIFSEGLGLLSTATFFLWTNLGVVLTTDMYQKNIVGLVESYINALPFLRNQLVGNIIIVPLVFLTIAYAKNVFLSKDLRVNLNFKK
jgi:hypothetical protein